ARARGRRGGARSRRRGWSSARAWATRGSSRPPAGPELSAREHTTAGRARVRRTHWRRAGARGHRRGRSAVRWTTRPLAGLQSGVCARGARELAAANGRRCRNWTRGSTRRPWSSPISLSLLLRIWKWRNVDRIFVACARVVSPLRCSPRRQMDPLAFSSAQIVAMRRNRPTPSLCFAHDVPAPSSSPPPSAPHPHRLLPSSSQAADLHNRLFIAPPDALHAAVAPWWCWSPGEDGPALARRSVRRR
ncbi:unnamed protein product, partial [Urochloa humidicola]